MKKLFIPIIFFFVLAVGFGVILDTNAATTQTINILSDNKLDSLNPTTTYSTFSYIEIGSCFTYGDQKTRYAGKFDTSPIDKTKDIEKAILKIDRVSQTWDSDSYGYSLYQLTNLYNQDTVNWNNAPSFSTTAESAGSKKDYGIFEFDVTNLAKGWQNNTIANNGFLIKKTNEDSIVSPSCVYGQFASTDYSGGETRPYLEITYYDPSITIDTINSTSPENIANWVLDKGSQINIAWATKSVGQLTIKILDRNDNVVYSINNDNVYKNAGFVMDYPANRYRFKIEAASNSTLSAYSPYFFINNPGDTTSPSVPSNIQVYHNPSDADNVIGFKFTLPSDSDYRMSRIYKSKTAGWQVPQILDTLSFPAYDILK